MDVSMIRNDDDDGGDEQGPQRVLDEGELAQLAEGRNAAIRRYLRDQRSRLEIVATTRTRRGQVLDWVPVESLAPDGVVADPPEEDGLDLRFLDEPADGEEVRPARLVSFELQEEGADHGPRGTVPVVRWDLDAITSTKTLPDFLSKHGRVARLRPDGFGDVAFPEDATVHKYAYSAQWVTAYGCGLADQRVHQLVGVRAARAFGEQCEHDVAAVVIREPRARGNRVAQIPRSRSACVPAPCEPSAGTTAGARTTAPGGVRGGRLLSGP